MVAMRGHCSLAIRSVTKEKYHPFSVKKSYLQQRAEKQTQKIQGKLV